MHPDKGGDKAEFDKLTTAYEILSDKDKRRKYDHGGAEAVGIGGGDEYQGFRGGGRGRW
jgi:DnaJ-class molecular chaperone